MDDREIVDGSRAVAEAADECGCGFFVLLNRALQEERAAARRDALNGRGLGIAEGNEN